MKKYLLIIIAILFINEVQAQQKPVVSQYMFNGLVLNPAYAGSNGYFSASAMFRNQWINMEGAPKVSTFTAHSNVKDKNIGLGMMITNDKVGVHSDLGMYLSYAYHLKLVHGTLSMGLQGGFNNLKSNFTVLNLNNPSDPLLNDQISDFKMNFGTGLYYYTENFYAGFSIPYLIKNRTLRDLDFTRETMDSRYYYLTTGIVLDISRNVKFKPSGLLRVEEGMPVAMDFAMNFFFNNAVNLGLSYRSGDSVISLFELQLNDYFRLGYAYDYIISELGNFTQGTHELMLNYRLNLFAPKHHKMCPGPYYF